ncbi:MAG: hypothetical protein HYW23_00310 [Candidatus Aenigmarchaeota archaeon]|nr:hypothetical protein [Candidatus Aenigmarchaeota archaeon]
MAVKVVTHIPVLGPDGKPCGKVTYDGRRFDYRDSGNLYDVFDEDSPYGRRNTRRVFKELTDRGHMPLAVASGLAPYALHRRWELALQQLRKDLPEASEETLSSRITW